MLQTCQKLGEKPVELFRGAIANKLVDAEVAMGTIAETY